MRPITPTSTRDLPIQIDKFSITEPSDTRTSNNLAPPRLWGTLSPKFTITQVRELVACEYITGIRFNITKYDDFRVFTDHFAEVRATQRHGRHVEICLDTNGPKVRTTRISRGFVDIFAGDTVVILPPGSWNLQQTFANEGYRILPIDDALPAVSRNEVVFLSDGWLQLVCLQDTPPGAPVVCRSLNDSRMYDTRGVDVSGMYEKREVLTAVDKALLERAAKFAVDPDYVALSFASTASHLYDTERFLRSIGMTCRLLAKIETTPALRNAHRLAEASDGLVVARGDLALHMARKGIDMLAAERQLIKICLMHQKRCFVATRVADSLEEGRAELDKFEMHRLRTEVMNGDMITLVLCNETSGGTNAIRNVTIVKTTIGKILEELTVTSLGFSRESSDDR